jgi:hypothetical protein
LKGLNMNPSPKPMHSSLRVVAAPPQPFPLCAPLCQKGTLILPVRDAMSILPWLTCPCK